MTMTELATRSAADLTPAAAPTMQTEATMSLVGWSTELDAAYKLATMICNTAFVPQHFKGKPEETAVAMLYGHTLELPPMVAVKAIYVVHGTPALYAQTMYAIAISKGHQIERVFADDSRVEFRARRKGQQTWQKIEWTIERARQAKYTSNGKYAENPIGMLTEKCKAEAAKLVAPDALAGLYSVEEIELGDYEPAEPSGVQDEPKPEPAKKKVTRKPRAAAPAPDLPPVVNDAPQDEPEPEQNGEDADTETGEIPAAEADGTQPADAAQIDAVVTALNNAGHTTKAAKQTAITEALGEQKSATQLTAFEADTLVTYFAEENQA